MAYADDITMPYTHECSQEILTTITYIKFVHGQNKTISHSTLTKQLALCSLQTMQNYEQSTQNKQHCTTQGNAPKDYGPYIRPKTHIQHTHSHYLSSGMRIMEEACSSRSLRDYKTMLKKICEFFQHIKPQTIRCLQ